MEETVFNHSTVVQIRFNDIDGLGHVNNTTIQEYFDLGRMHYMKDVFTNAIFSGEATLILANINTDFLSPVYLKDQLEVKTAIVRIGTKSLQMEQQVIDKASGVVKAMCKSVMVAFLKIEEVAIEIKPEWREQVCSREKKEL
ncbi:acyl-CoA thioesterase [Carboxylicivirga marina]|uniref:Acyl-CoA thioesterase n=1 Tax=Carboxylicivirga marina TaxID=2800988 RepID=A0ABS1HJ94_9BACT|nr:acyl-CoA thioesterase [Carboxylicivirga marina]MBK3517264.1 acyl-CoA thioesterase [Carboxylicivirga marina]